ncbi:formate/nitrite transporter family protein [uncultured Senegalimassilia sp.]|uniref:formate/nitrite transporter family protein n=1 Tax=uncultured Senegalimassilia sp. TaxID=1714350 RepID=UPI0025E47DDA|nr:formate/nitrite transporter family protein [uncultured Senegalimassilia sp.]
MAMDQSDVKALRSDALGPAEIEAKAETLAVGKAGMAGAKCFVLAMLAGAFIAFGATYFLVFLGDSAVPFAAQRMVGGICFSLGLVLVLCCGAELFTGNMLMVTGLASKKIKLGGLVRNWVIVWLGNLVGSLFVVALIYWCGVGAMNGGAVGDAMVSVAVGKVTPDWLVLMAKGIMCNVMVCLAVWIGFSARTVVDKVLGIMLPISFFVAAGFEHCVANMYFLPLAFVLKLSGYAPEGVPLDVITIENIVKNLSAATVGNTIAGVVLVLMYWAAFRKRA